MARKKLSRELYSGYASIFFMAAGTMAMVAGYQLWTLSPEKTTRAVIDCAIIVIGLTFASAMAGYYRGVLLGHVRGQLEFLEKIEDEKQSLKNAQFDESPNTASTVKSMSGDLPEGRLDGYVRAVRERFWNPSRGFNPNDRSTHNTIEQIVEWVREKYPELSDKKARAIEAVACPIDR